MIVTCTIFGRQNDFNVLLCLTTEHVFENFRKKIAQLSFLRQRHNAVLGLLYKSSFGPRSNLSFGPVV